MRRRESIQEMKFYGMADDREYAIFNPAQIALGVIVLGLLHVSSLYSYVLFHSLVELLQLTVIFGIFAITWHSRKWSDNAYLVFVGISFPFVGILILLHTLAYKGMGVFQGADANLPTQLWIALRYLQGAALLVAPAFIGRGVKPGVAIAGLATITALLIYGIFSGRFPDCFVEGKGLTEFKIWSEYVIAVLLFGGLVMLVRRRAAFDPTVLRMLVLSLATGIAAELSFTQYASVYGPANKVGHFLLLISTYFVYRAILVTGIVNPFRLLFLGLKQKEGELEAKVAERTAALAQSEERFHGIAEAAQDAIIMIDHSGKLTYWNPAAERIFGYRSDEIAGRDLHHILVAPQYLSAYEEGFKMFQDTGTGPMLGKTLELTAIRRDGSEFPVSLAVSALRLNNGWHAVGIVRDISDRQHAEELRKRLAAIVESSTVAIIGKDLHGNVTSWNLGAERIYGYSAGEMIGKPIRMLADDKLKHETEGLVQKVLRGESVSRYETVRRRKDGRAIDVSLTLSPVRDEAGQIIGVSTIANDITERKRAERELKAVNRALKTLSSCNGVLIHASDEMALLKEMCRIIVEVGEYRFAWVGYAQNDGDKTVRPMASWGDDDGYLAALPVYWSESRSDKRPASDAIRTGVVQIHQDLEENPVDAPWHREALRRGYKAAIGLPLRCEGKVIGSLAIFAKEADTFLTEEVKLLTELADDLAFGISTMRTRAAEAQSAARLRKSMESTISVIANTFEMRDPYTSGHQQRVAELAAAIGTAMGLDDHRVYGIYLAGIVHDLGKITVPAEILSKPGRLSAIEYELIKAHPKAGYDLLKPVDFPWPIADIVLQHHERMDGGGYPAGLKGEEILLEARIICVADVVEAISSHRPYRPAFGIEAALQEIREHRGDRYDPAVVDTCLRLFDEGKFQFGQNKEFVWRNKEEPALAEA